jgi:hypothetical protein
MTLEEDLAWLMPPDTSDDPEAWDTYWQEQLSHGLGPGLIDMFCFDHDLVHAFHKQGVRAILCPGSGISQEPRALAAAGFEVTALDLSPFAMQVAESIDLDDEGLANYIETSDRRPGGSIRFVTGNLFDATVCPGPYDVVLERRTIQNFPDAQRETALEVLAARLAKTGIFFSHYHDNAWRPGDQMHHSAERWFEDQGWTIWRTADPPGALEGRAAWLFVTTG